MEFTKKKQDMMRGSTTEPGSKLSAMWFVMWFVSRLSLNTGGMKGKK